MTTQLTFLEPAAPEQYDGNPLAPVAEAEARARSSDPESSHAAAKRMNDTGKTVTQVEQILAVVQRGGGWTSYEIAKATGLTNVEVSRRLRGIKEIKKADESLARICRVRRIKLSTYWSRAMFDVDED